VTLRLEEHRLLISDRDKNALTHSSQLSIAELRPLSFLFYGYREEDERDIRARI
jgi:hypothetical protein